MIEVDLTGGALQISIDDGSRIQDVTLGVGQIMVELANEGPQGPTGSGGGGGGAVDSVNGYTGVVVLVKGDLGLSNIDNTSDADKPVSTATATAIGLKADKARLSLVSVTFTDEDTSQTLDVADATVTIKTFFGIGYESEDFAVQGVHAHVLSVTPGVGYTVLVVAPDGATGQIDLIVTAEEAA